MTPVFITGTGTGVGKTIASVIICNALKADYWKPVQAGSAEGYDRETVHQLLHETRPSIAEAYNLSMPASPHIAARKENKHINIKRIMECYASIIKDRPHHDYLVIEGAGGLLVPLNENQFVVDLVLELKAKVIIVSRNYLGSINHSLLTAELCRNRGVNVAGWVFNDDYLQYEAEISHWSGYPVIGRIPALEHITPAVLYQQSLELRNNLLQILES